MIYRIYLTATPGLAGTPDDDAIRATAGRAPAVERYIEKIAYKVVKANGGLDTWQGNDIRRKVRELDVRRGGTVTMYGRTLFVTASRVGA